MAGAGYKVFADGDVLTAAQVQTYLQDQAVMRFADSSARTTALGTAVAEGMLSYLDDVDEVQVYDGSSWGAVGLPLGTATPTDGQFLSYATATSTWDPTTLSLSGFDLTDLGDVSGTPTDGQILEYDSGTSSWGPAAKPESGLVAVKYSSTGSGLSFSGVAAGDNRAITGVSITHAMSSATNKLIIHGFMGQGQGYSGSASNWGGVGIAVAAGGSLIELGNASGSRSRTTAGPWVGLNNRPMGEAFTILYSPGSTSSITYTLRAINVAIGTRIMYVNRTRVNTDNAEYPTSRTGLLIQEVSV